jgi:hypothetical protein
MSAALDRKRLSKILSLSASPCDFEALAACRKANDLVYSAGLSWGDIVDPVDRPSPHVDIDALIDFCLSWAGGLTSWELGFAKSLSRRRYALSDRQIETLLAIAEKARRHSRKGVAA